MTERGKVMSRGVKKVISVLAGILLAALLSLPYIFFQEEIQRIQALGYIGLFLSCAISNISVLMPSSSTLIVVTAASTLNPWLCVLVGGIGVAIGEQTSYLCGRVGILGFGDSLPQEKTKTMFWLRKNAFLTVFLFALIPLPVFDLVGIAAGAIHIRWHTYAIASVLGKILRFILVIATVYYLLPWYLQFLSPESGDFLYQFAKFIFPAT